MELDQLRYFLRVAERGSFTRAAEDLGLTQPALSRSIRKLEDELGQPVLEREARALTLTDAGALLAARARQVLAILEDTRAEISDDGETGHLRVGAIPTIAPYFLPGLLRQVGEAFPRATLGVRENTTDSLVESCLQGEIDFAVLAFPVPSDQLRAEELFEEELFLVLPPKHELARAESVRLRDIESHPFVLLDEAHCLSSDIISYCRKRSFQPVAVERTAQLATVQELVSLAHGISMIPAMARELDQDPRRVYRSLAGPKPTRRLAVVWNPGRFQSRLARGFLEELRAYARDWPLRTKPARRRRS